MADNPESSQNILAILIILLGGYFLTRDLGLLPQGLPFLPAIMIGVGLFLLGKRNK